MTFFLKQTGVDPATQDVVRPPSGISTFLQGLGASYRAAQLERDGNFKAARTRTDATDDLARKALDRMGLEALQPVIDERNRKAREMGMNAQIREMPATAEEAVQMFGPNFSKVVLEQARAAAKANPEAWADMDLSDEAIETDTNARLQAEYQDAQDIIDMMPSGEGAATLIAGFGAGVADVRNLPFLLLGGGAGSLWRVASREALINTGAEAAFLPSQFDMAERLDIPDPNVAETLATAAIVGAGFGVVLEGGARAIRYARARNTVTEALPGRTLPQSQAMVDMAEDALASDRADALEQIARIPERVPAKPPYLLENPINPERPPLIERAVERGAAQVEPPVRAEPSQADMRDTLAPEQPAAAEPPAEDVVATLEAEADRMEAEATRGRKSPFLQALKRQGVRIETGTPEAQELYSILGGAKPANQRVPGLFSRKKTSEAVSTGTALDNLPASEWEREFPGISSAAGVDNGYLSLDGVYDIIRREAAGDFTWMQRVAEARTVRRMADEVRREAENPTQSDFLAGERVEGGVFLTRDEAGFLEYRDVEAMVRSHFQQSGLFDFMTPREFGEVVAALRENGGDPDFALAVLNEREARYEKSLRRKANERPSDENAATATRGSERDADRAGGGGGAAGSPNAPAGPDQRADAQPVTEATAAGDQIVAPGIAPVTERQRLEAQMNRPMRGGTAAADDGLFDMNARLQTDMFEPDSPAFQERTQAVTQSFRDDIETNGDFEMELALDDGRVLRSAKEALDYLDEGDEFADIIALCGRPKGDTA